MLVPTTCFNCESACGLLAYVDSETLTGPQVRRQSRASRLARTQLREGPGDAQPGHRPRSHPLSAQARRRTRRGQMGAGDAGTRRSTTSPRASARRSSRVAETRSCITSAARARTASPSACSRRGASTATTRTPTSARPAVARAITLDGARPPEPRPRQRRSHPADQRAPRVGALFNPHAQRVIEGKTARREADRLRHAALEHARRTPTTGSRRIPASKPRSCSRSRTT